jgi:hypothetical protein
MKRSAITQSLVGALSVGALAAICLTGTPAAAQYVAPTPEIIATLVPVYHEGHAVYYYHGYWHYRDHGAWAYYHEEPVFLHEWRSHHAFEWHHYGRR